MDAVVEARGAPMDGSVLFAIPCVLIGVPMLLFGLAITLNLGGFTERRTQRSFELLRETVPSLKGGTPPPDVVEREVRLSRLGGRGLVSMGLFIGVLLPLAVRAMSNGTLF